VGTSHTQLVTLAVDLDVFNMTLLKLLHGFFNVFHSTILTHLLGRDVGVETGTVPVTRDRLGLEGDDDTEFFGDTVEEPSGDPELVTD
jgi:hypothetical protein